MTPACPPGLAQRSLPPPSALHCACTWVFAGSVPGSRPGKAGLCHSVLCLRCLAQSGPSANRCSATESLLEFFFFFLKAQAWPSPSAVWLRKSVPGLSMWILTERPRQLRRTPHVIERDLLLRRSLSGMMGWPGTQVPPRDSILINHRVWPEPEGVLQGSLSGVLSCSCGIRASRIRSLQGLAILGEPAKVKPPFGPHGKRNSGRGSSPPAPPPQAFLHLHG